MARQGLASRSIAAVYWGSGGALLRMLLQFGCQIALARQLGPSEYGVFAVGLLTVTFSMFFADVGLAAGLIQKKSVSPEDIRFIFTWQVLLGSAVAACMVLASGSIASFFGEARAGDVIKALAALCLVNAMMAPSSSLLKRDLRQKQLQACSLVSYFVGFVLVGIPLAWWTRSVWSLVAAWLVQAVLAGAAAYAIVRHPVRPLIWYPGARSQGAFGGLVFVTNIVNWLSNNLDRIVVGRVLPSRDIGLYTQTYNLYYAPVSSLMGVLYPVLLSTSARITASGQRHELAQVYLALMSGIAFLVLPLLAGASAASQTIVLLLFGDAWADSIPLAAPMALLMVPLMMYGVTTPLVWVGSRKSDEVRAQLPLVLAWVVGAYAVCREFGAVGVAWAAVAFAVVRVGAVTLPALSQVGLPVRELMRALRGGVVLTVPCALAVGLSERLLASHAPAGARLPLLCLAGVVVYATVLRTFPGLMHPALVRLVDKATSRLPGLVRRGLKTLGLVR